jgi:hypothetical protein
MDRPDGRNGSYLRGSPYTFEGEVEFAQEAGRRISRRGWGKYVRWSIYLLAFGIALRLAVAGIRLLV